MPGLADPSRNLEWLADRQLLLLRGETLQMALRRFRGERMRAAVASRRELLALPSPSIAQIVRQDPLGLYDLLGAQLGEAMGISAANREDGYVTR